MLKPRTPKAKDIFRADHSIRIGKAIQEGKINDVRKLVAEASDLNEQGDTAITLLHWSVYHKQIEATIALLAAGANIQIWDHLGETPAHLAVGMDDYKYLELMLEQGIDPNLRDQRGVPLIIKSIMSNRRPQLELLIEYEADLDITDNEVTQHTPLHAAGLINAFSIIHLLLLKGANPLKKDSSGKSFQTYFFDVDEDILTDSAVLERRAIMDWMESNDVALEAPK